MIPNKILELVEKQSDVLICPTLPYGDADFHTEYTGTISIGSDLLEIVMKRILKNVVIHLKLNYNKYTNRGQIFFPLLNTNNPSICGITARRC